MVRNILLATALAAAFAMPAFAATTTAPKPAPKPAKLYYVELVGGVCKVSDAVTAAPTLTAPDVIEPNAKGYKSLASAKADLASLVKAKTCKTA
ncbi:MAG: hypothetical protein WDM94_05390 [Bauldia sp.]